MYYEKPDAVRKCILSRKQWIEIVFQYFNIENLVGLMTEKPLFNRHAMPFLDQSVQCFVLGQGGFSCGVCNPMLPDGQSYPTAFILLMIKFLTVVLGILSGNTTPPSIHGRFGAACAA